MLNDVDQSLRSLIQTALAVDDTPPAVSFTPPTPDWTSTRENPVLNLFLYDVREDLDGQPGDVIDVRDEEGTLIGRQPPLRRYRLSYLTSAWCDDAEAEHAVLGAILARVPDEPGIPADHLVGRLAEQGLPVRIHVGVPLTRANTWDLWSALGTSPRTAIEIVVTAPLVPELRTELEPPAVKLELGVSRDPSGATGTEGHPAAGPELEEQAAGRSARSKASKAGKSGKKTSEDSPGPELEARPGKRWTTFRVREEAVPAPSSD